MTTAPEHSRRKANFYFFTKIWLNLILIVIGAVLIGVFMRNVQDRTAMTKQKENSELALTTAAEILNRNTENADSLTGIYHEGNQNILNDIELLLSNGLLQSMQQKDSSIHSQIFSELASRVGINYLFLMSMDGKIAISADEALYGINPAVTGLMTQENVNGLLRWPDGKNRTVSPVLVRNQFGTFYFYSKPLTHLDRQYALVIGVKASVLDDQIASRRDYSIVLSRSAVINGGFLFAVDKKDDLFLYYKSESHLLTGHNALSCGLAPEALNDGFSGIVTILGTEYYCVSRAFGDDTVLCAAAPCENMLSNDRDVLFWTILGFCVVMILCLAYAVIVRNDFVRRAVTTDRIVLRKDSENPIYFDKSVFAKVFPLMLIGVLAMFAISFYTQTLLEITEGIEKSDVALQEVIGRYEESSGSRQIIQDYYNDRFLSTAKLLSFILEETPDVLNAPSDKYHAVLDEKGDREYLLDDEGNRLKSVSESVPLKELCARNGIDAIYLYDEDGHTIATSTPNWFFTLSHNAEDQSYAFREVLEGRSDSYVQKHMTSDMGEETQFFGVAFHYYTTRDKAGNTVYMSRYAFEEATAESPEANGVSAGGITKHPSLLQIEMDEDLAGKLFASISADAILSTNMLEGGAIVLFDAKGDHACIYSPKEASIGKTAAELGVSPKAFSGDDYYGFSRINGISYFQYFRYLNDEYYIATAIPGNTLFPARGWIALLSAGMCFILIMILFLTVTLTSRDEEILFETMSEEQMEQGLNSAIFNIILPSGRSVHTTKASARWDNRRIRWGQKSPEQKLGVLLGVVFVLLLLCLFLYSLRIIVPDDSHSIVRYIISGSWDRSLNLFAVSACFLVMIITVIVIAVLRIPVRIITALLGARGETIGHLLLSIVKYGGTIGAVFYCLYLVGVDSGSLLASAGILSLVIGLGAQSLIKDIIAGIFIVFEGEFRVGDIVTISDFRGTVMDIGLRTTKIMAADGNIKIFNNSDISGVLNMTKEISLAAVNISIEYGQDIDYVEAVLNRDLPALREKNSDILEGPTYAGVSELGDSGVTLTVFAKCSEQHVRGIKRFLNKEVLQIFYRNDINVPFPNITVSQMETANRKTMEDFTAEDSSAEGREEDQK